MPLANTGKKVVSTVTKTLPPAEAKTAEIMLEDVQPESGKRIAIVGPSGAGKTWLAATWPNPAFLDTDRNISTLKQAEWRKYAGVTDRKQIIVAYASDPTDTRGLLKGEPTGFWQVMDKLNEWGERSDIDTIVIDSMTALSRLARNLGMFLSGKDNRSQTQKEANRYGVPLLTQADFGAEMSVMEQLLDQVPMLEGKTIIFNCHVKIERNTNGGIISYAPLITGDSHRAQFGRWFNEVWWLDTQGQGDKARRVLQTRQDNMKPFVKTTMGLPMEITNPTYKKIMQSAA